MKVENTLPRVGQAPPGAARHIRRQQVKEGQCQVPTTGRDVSPHP